MPELPEVERTRRELEPVMQGARFERVLLRRADPRTPFPSRFAARLRGLRVTQVNRRGKYLLVELSSGDTLVMHLGMSGAFSVKVAGNVHVDVLQVVFSRPSHVNESIRRTNHVVVLAN